MQEVDFMSATIRAASPQDALALMQLNAAFNGPGGQTLENIRAALQRPGPEYVLVAEAEGEELVGFCCCLLKSSFCYEAPTAEITEFFISPDYRRQGIGTRLLNTVLSLCRSRGAKEITLLTGDDNIPAQAFYKSLGFVPSGELHMEWGGEESR